MVDIPGHFNFRTEIMKQAPSAKAVILILDAKDKTKFGEAAEILFDLLNEVDVFNAGIPILVACNKQDLPFAKKAIQVERELAQEIEQIKRVRLATR